MPTTLDALLIVALVLTPGYLFTQVARKTIAYLPEATDARFLLTIASAGIVIHALAYPWTSHILNYYPGKTLPAHQGEIYGWGVLTIFFLPVTLGIIIGLLSKPRWVDAALHQLGMGKVDRLPSAWDFVIREKFPAYVRVYLKDGKGVIAGIYQKQSFGSFSPGKSDIYLEKCWQLDDDNNFYQAVNDSKGVWISQDMIAYVEFLNNEEARDVEQRQQAGGDEGHRDRRSGDPGLGQEGGTADGSGEPAAAAADHAAAII